MGSYVPKEIKVPALKVEQPLGDFYVSVMGAKQLNSIAWVDVRRMAGERGEIDRYLGVQRHISPERIKKIKQYVKTKEATFPTSIIVAVPEKCTFWDEDTNAIIFREYIDEEEPGNNVYLDDIAKILDGQHRLRGLKEADEELDGIDEDSNDLSKFQLNVAIFVGADIAQQANIFATVNLAQTKVNRSLVYDLAEYSKSRSPQKTCHYTAVALDKNEKSPFFKSIKRLGTATPGRKEEGFKETLTQATFVDGLIQHITADEVSDRDFLIRNAGKKLRIPTESEKDKMVLRDLFVNEEDTLIAKIYWAYFQAVANRWPEAWERSSDKGNIIKKTNGYRAFAKFFGDLYKTACHDKGERLGVLLPSSDYKQYFDKINIDDYDFNVDTYPPGTTGETKLYRDLLQYLS
ncbi:DGQHR domain-containing protein [Vreelandella piezotolerans]|uniref:DGQHR domain-containing protein n=1 Tax=Vreelandella piezotolerans TaxID=2609667 RepID=UPI001C630E41|nr:DGQHR domain-containing protein [Halomonas piezotolerans]